MDIRQEEKWMFYALKEANNALIKDEIPIGSIIVQNNTIVGRGYNQVETLNDATAHAEIISITSASNTVGDWRLNGCSLYVTKEPCIMCIGAILNSRIEKIYYGMANDDCSIISNNNFMKFINNRHLKYIQGKILEYECKKIIQDFF